MAKTAPGAPRLALALSLLFLGIAPPRALGQGATRSEGGPPPAPPPPTAPPAGSRTDPTQPLDVPAPILVPEPLVEPPSRRVEALPPPQRIQRMRLELVVGGAGILLSVWAADRLLARDLSPDWPSWLPLAGPWYLVDAERRQSTPGEGLIAALVIDGLVQAAGATMVVLGLVLRKDRLVIRLPPAAPGASLRLGGPGGVALVF